MSLPKSINCLIVSRLLKDKNHQKSYLYALIRGLSVISNYIFSLLIIQFFSKEDYGIYVYGLSVFMLLSVFLKAGVDVHLVKIFSEFKTNLIPKWVYKVEKKVFYFAVTISAIISCGIYITNPTADSSFIIILFVFSVPLHVKVLLNSGKLRGISKIVQFAFLNIAGRILLSLVVFIILYYLFSFKSIYSIYISHVISIILLLVISFFWIRKEFLNSNETEEALIPADFFTYNNGLLLKSYITVLFLWGDRFFLSLISDSSEVARYDISLKVAMLIMIITEALKSTYAPVFAKHILEPQKLKIDIIKSTRVGFVSSLMIFIFIIVFGKVVLGLFGDEFKESYNILVIISLGYTIASFFGQADNVVEMCGLIKYYIKPYFIIIILSLGLGVFLSVNLGALGMAVGFSIGNILFQAFASYIVKFRINIKTSFI